MDATVKKLPTRAQKETDRGPRIVRPSREDIGEEPVDEGPVGLERVEAAVERIGRRRREAVVGALAHDTGTGHSTTALPWCQEGS